MTHTYSKTPLIPAWFQLSAAAALAACLCLPALAQVAYLNPGAAPPQLLVATPEGAGTTDTATAALRGVTGPATVQPRAATNLGGNPAAPMLGEIDLGQSMNGGEPGQAAVAPVTGVARRAALAASQKKADSAGTLRATADRAGIERAVFARLPVRVGLPVNRERLITLPSPAVLHVPSDMDAVARIESIDRTLYITALVPFAQIRIVAELIEGGQQIPLDLVANTQTAAASQQLEVFIEKQRSTGGEAQADAAVTDDAPAADMVDLTRFASRLLYAPSRLAISRPGVSQVQVSTKPVMGLVRDALVETVPMGQWRSAGLYVTAVRITNKSNQPLDIRLDNLRGKWIAVTAQHGRLGAAGSEADTSALYLICDRAFDACL
jgi:integrating conjugative element protein (TIGR03749 family)